MNNNDDDDASGGGPMIFLLTDELEVYSMTLSPHLNYAEKQEFLHFWWDWVARERERGNLVFCQSYVGDEG